MIGIVDYGIGNTGSLLRAFKKIDTNARLVHNAPEVLACSHLVLPGVGSFGAAVATLRAAASLSSAISKKVILDRIPVLGICLGLQLMAAGSEESDQTGLGWLLGYSRRMSPADGLKVPNVGWSRVDRRGTSALLEGIPKSSEFYFAHSYTLSIENKSQVVATAKHGPNFPAIVEHENLFGVQFHPEKSYLPGMKLLTNFARLSP